MNFTHGLLSLGAGLMAGIMNAIAGGGTLLTFPTLIWLGLNSITANATSTVAVWPGIVSGMAGYRRELGALESRYFYLAIPSLLGGLAGAWLLRLTPSSVFDRAVPYLILFATLLFMVQQPLQRRMRRSQEAEPRSEPRPKQKSEPRFELKPEPISEQRSEPRPEPTSGQKSVTSTWLAGAIFFQLLVGLYGGYFGAGIGIMMLAALSILGMTDIHQMNGFKNLLAAAINAIAAIYFISQKMVYWPDVGMMAAGAVAGGYLGAGTAHKIGPKAVRRVVLLIGFGMAISLFLKR